MRCPHCQADNSAGARFCHQCGTTLTAPRATFCPRCGQPAAPGASFCGGCGQPLSAPAAPATSFAPSPATYPTYAPAGERYAGFWIRFAAYLIDSLILMAFSFLLYAIAFAIRIASSTENAFGEMEPAGWTTALYIFAWLGTIVGTWVYFARLESGPRQATIGKRALGLYVTAENGRPISFGRASGRYWAKLLSSLTLLVGYMLAGWTKRKQALHDMIAATTVRRR